VTLAATPTLTGLPQVTRLRLAVPGRLLWIELRRNVMPWLLPIIAVVFWLDSYRQTLGQLPTWSAQTAITMGQGHPLIDFGPIVAGAGAWMGSREGRRDVAELASISARSRWAGQLVTWLATICWTLAGYLVLVGAMYAVIASRVTWGGPPWWPVAAGAAGVVALATVGFVAGALAPGRFVAPFSAFGAFVLLVMSSHAGFTDRVGVWSILLVSGQGGLGFDSGIFYPFFAGLSIARVIWSFGISVAALGVLGLRGARDRRLVGSVIVIGVLAVGGASWLLSTARVEAHGAVIPAFDGAASDRLIPYTPVCSADDVPVCLHPAYRSLLPDLAAAIEPVGHEVKGLPGAPVRVVQVAASYLAQDDVRVVGDPPVLELAVSNLGLGRVGSTDFDNQIRLIFLHAFLGAGSGPGTLAQQAVQAALLSEVGVSFTDQQPPSANRSNLYNSVPGPNSKGSSIFAVAARLVAQPEATHVWLVTHLGVLRAGDLALDQLP
jgi:hypothetical protein